MECVNLLIKPASFSCDLRCSYCFYMDEAGRRGGGGSIMSVDALEELVRKAFSGASHRCIFSFQGGEPTLAGLDFYRALMRFEKALNPRRIAVQNTIQTNGVRIDRAWAGFLSENRFLVGLSMDGPKDIHDRNRRYPDGRGSFDAAAQAAALLRGCGADLNILCVVTDLSCLDPRSFYRFFTDNGFRYLQFIPCMEPLTPCAHGPSLSPDSFARFLCETFSLWWEDVQRGSYTSVRHIDNLIRMALGRRPECCSMSGKCSVQFVVESDGSVFPCDFYVDETYKLGSIGSDWEEMAYGKTAARFLSDSGKLPEKCRLCRYVRLCRNGCRRDRDPSTGISRYCGAWTAFFDKHGEDVYRAAELFR